ncbi:MAG TPA: VTT domain-containing protein [Cyclobacteriaceae bacterium]|nr:VTT domain-containing protein [Cyclobacteriaceae bacterium]
MEQREETRSSFLFKNLVRGLLWFAVIITIFILLEDYLQENFKNSIEAIQDKPLVLYGAFFASEVIFGLIPPEFFMMVWILHKISLPGYAISLTILTILSYIAGIMGYYIGKRFSNTGFFRGLHERYLEQYDKQLRRYGGYLVFVGAVTPLPFSAMCMLAGSIHFNFKEFLLICVTRVVRFAVYGWMVWSFPNWFS